MVYFKSFIVASALTLLPVLVNSSPVAPHYFQRDYISKSKILPNQVENELGPLLTEGSLVFGPTDSKFYNATSKWNTLVKPDIQVVVQPASESDIAKIVKYCNRNSFEFFVRNRGHGTPAFLADFSGVEINVELLQGLTILPDKKTALIQGGAYGANVIQTLWDEGFVTTAGSAGCVGLLGPSLGGGHSRYEGLYGMIMDGIVHFNLVLANGKEIGVNATSHPDLLWALKGAGHNFGIVTSIVKKIYPADTWHVHTYTWTQDKLEKFFAALNKLDTSYNGTKNPRMGVNYGNFIFNTSVSTTEAVIEWAFHYAGPAEEAEKLLTEINAIGAVSEASGDYPYPALFGAASGVCPPAQRAVSHVLAQTYNITAERKLFNHYTKNALKYPDIINPYIIHEGYATAGYQAIPSESTAYAHRDENYILAFFSEIPEGNKTLQATADTWAKESWQILRDGQPTRPSKTYINYGQGNKWETLESVYGYEPWRLNRLRALKKRYDPENSFRYYLPIV